MARGRVKGSHDKTYKGKPVQHPTPKTLSTPTVSQNQPSSSSKVPRNSSGLTAKQDASEVAYLEKNGVTQDQINTMESQGEVANAYKAEKQAKQVHNQQYHQLVNEKRDAKALAGEENNIEGFNGSEPLSRKLNPNYSGSGGSVMAQELSQGQQRVPTTNQGFNFGAIAKVLKDNLHKEVYHQLGFQFQRGVIVSLQTGTVTVTIENASSNTTGVPWMGAYNPTVGDNVLILSLQPWKGGYDKIIIGSYQENVQKLALPWLTVHSMLIGAVSNIGANDFQFAMGAPTANGFWPIGYCVNGTRMFAVDNNGQVNSAASPKLTSGYQETGYVGNQAPNSSASGNIGIGCNFKSQMTNVPSGISYSNIASTGFASQFANNFDAYGCFIGGAASGNNPYYLGTYTTIGN